MKKTIFTREELYELVWNKPISKIAKELNVSEEEIKQTCIKLKAICDIVRINRLLNKSSDCIYSFR